MAAAYRPKEVEKLFSSEIEGITHSIALDDSTLYHGVKSKIKDRFQSTAEPLPNMDQSSAIIIELSPVVFRLAGRDGISNFNEFAVKIYYHLMEIGKGYHRIDVVCDRYFPNSLKDNFELREELEQKQYLQMRLRFHQIFAQTFFITVKTKMH